MIGEGRGEVLTEYELRSIEDYDLQVLVPEGVSVSTAQAYGGIVPKIPEVSLKEALAMPVAQWDGVLVNDFEVTVFEKHPELAAIKRSLYDSGAVYASMSGSGSALFALYEK
jgi:4-diphosphocytidyl-2-C-methyl-D-erythritol kinase